MLQSGGITALAPAPSVSFAGLDKANWGDGWPPDTNGDVGPLEYIQTVNTSIGIFRKSDGYRLAAFTFDTLFARATTPTNTPCDNSNRGDPVVVYDAQADHWIISDFAWSNFSTGPFYECFAVSKTGDPVRGGWWLYAVQIDSSSNLPDYPKLGVWPDGIYMSANVFSTTGAGSFKNVRVWSFNRSDMESGLALRAVKFDLPKIVGGVTVFSLLPSNLRGTPPPLGRENLFTSIWGAYAARVWKFHADWTTLANSTFTGPWNVPIGTFSVGPSTVPEQGGNNLDTLTYRVMMQAQYRNLGGQESIWLAHTVGNGGSPNIASVRWYQLNVTGSTIQTSGPVQQGTWNGSPADSTHRFMPSLAVDGSGDMAIGYSVSSSILKPAISYAGRLVGDPAGTLGQGEQSLINGTGAQTNTCGGNPCTRWGDYSAMSVDPVDDCTFWYTNEYYDVGNNSGGGNWQTRIGSFKFDSCTAGATATPTPRPTASGATYVPLTPARLLDTRIGLGLSGTFSSGIARTFQVSGRGGVPANAVAVTGNLTVTDQTSLGYVALTTNPTNSPTTSTINFPVADNRANGVTAPLSGTGTLSATYIGTTSGQTTDLIFDVTGYFVPDASGATYVPLTPARLLDTRIGLGLSGTFSSGIARTFQVSGRGGVPANAVAVTGNLTVTDQTSLGYVALTTNPTNSPTTSTINFPVADNRANGVTAPLSGTGTLSATYIGTTSGQTTDLIFDVTGYFVP